MIIRVKDSGKILLQGASTPGYFWGNGTVVYFDCDIDYIAVRLTYNHHRIIPKRINIIMCKLKKKKSFGGINITLGVLFLMNFPF